jgi:hypothetical protein
VRAALALATAYFLFAAFVQLNDPDSAIWIVLYVAAATSTLLACFRRGHWLLPLAVGATALVWGATLAPALARSTPAAIFGHIGMVDIHAEEAREALGLFIVAAIQLPLAWKLRPAAQPAASAGS